MLLTSNLFSNVNLAALLILSVELNKRICKQILSIQNIEIISAKSEIVPKKFERACVRGCVHSFKE